MAQTKSIVRNGIYFDTSSKGRINHQHHSFRAEVRVDGKRIRKRFATHKEAERWMDEWTKEQ